MKNIPDTISVIIPAYNAERFLRETCQSLLNQTCPDWEVIIIDDGSQDATPDIARSFCTQDKRFRLISQPNAGVSAARNAGIDTARGEFIAFLDADDLWEKTAVEQFLTMFANRPDVDILWSDAIRFDSITSKAKPVVWKNYLATGDPWLDMLVHHFIPISGTCLRMKESMSVYRFRTDITHGEDRDFLLRILRHHKAIPLSSPVLYSRQHLSSASHNATAALQGEQLIMQEHLADQSIPRHIRRRAWSALAFRCAVIAAFVGHDYSVAMQWYLKAILRDPLNINNYLLPLRKVFLSLKHQ